jgi:hypothetical protein
MRRRNDRHACNPHAISGDEIAARLGAHVARRPEPAVTGSISLHRSATAPRLRPSAYADHKADRDLPDAVPGADGEN